MKEYIFFDLDGTLTDPALGITNSLIYALEKFGIEVASREELYQFIGPPLIEKMMEVYGFSKEKATKCLMYYREYFSDKGLFENLVYDGIPEMLADLRSSGYKLVLATSKPEVYARRILEHFNLAKYFEYIGGCDLGEKLSTKAAVIKYVMDTLGINEPSTCIMVGDREHDVIGARNCGLECVGVLFGYGTREELARANANYIVDSVSTLAKLLKKI